MEPALCSEFTFFFVCRCEKTTLWKLCQDVVLVFFCQWSCNPKESDDSSLIVKCFLKLCRRQWECELWHFWLGKLGFHKIKCLETAGFWKLFLFSIFSYFFLYCICSSNLIYPELYHNCGYISVCVYVHVYVSVHSGELTTVLPWKFHLM